MIALMTKMMLSCEEATFLISKKQHQKLTFKENLQLKMHLFSCYLCRRYEKEIAVLTQSFSKMKSDAEAEPPRIKLSEAQKQKLDETLKCAIDEEHKN